MSALSPTGHAQPTPSDADNAPSNPATKNPSEKQSSDSHTKPHSQPGDQKIPQKQASEDEAQPWAQGRGIRGAPAGEEAKGKTEEDVGRHNELDGEQMAMPGEGRVADAVAGRGGGGNVGGEQESLTADLDRKKAEQAEAREKMKKQRAENTQVGGALGQQGGPASTVEY